MDTEPIEYLIQKFKELLKSIISGSNDKSLSVLPEMYTVTAKLKLVDSVNVIHPRIVVEACKVLVKLIHNLDDLDRKAKKYFYSSSVASSIILQILTSPGMDKRLYNEDNIDKILSSMQLRFFHFRKDYTNQQKLDTNLRSILLTELNLLSDLVVVHSLTEIAVNKISSIGLRAMEYVNPEFSMTAIKLLTKVFSKYEDLQYSLLPDIEESLILCANGLPGNIYQLDICSENIHVFSALVLNLFQNIVVVTDDIRLRSKYRVLNIEQATSLEVIIRKKYRNILFYASAMIKNLVEKYLISDCSKDKHTAFGVFLDDLVNVVMKPECPAALTLLTYSAKHIVNSLVSHDLVPSLRILLLDWLCKIMKKICYCILLVKEKSKNLEEMVLRFKKTHPELFHEEYSENGVTISKITLKTLFLRYIHNKLKDPDTAKSVESFYITMWISELIVERESLNKLADSEENKENIPPPIKKRQCNIMKKAKNQKKSLTKIDAVTLSNINYLLNFCDGSVSFNREELELIMSFIFSREDIMIHFDVYLNHIVNMMKNSPTRVRVKILQCLKSLIDIDISLAKIPLIQHSMKCFIKDRSIAVREITADLMGQCLLHSPTECEYYYHVLCEHVTDRGVSVRKRIIKIFGDLTINFPKLSCISEIYLKMLELINDVALTSFLMDFFIETWFSLNTTKTNHEFLANCVINMRQMINVGGDPVIKNLQILFKEVFARKNNTTNNTCKHLVKYLVNHVLKLEADMAFQELDDDLKILYVISSVNPQILVEYISVLELYLSLRCQENENIIISVTGILKNTAFILENTSETFIMQVEEDLVKLMFSHKQNVVESCIPCLAVIIRTLTHNSNLIRECFSKFYGTIKYFVQNVSRQNEVTFPESYIQRSVFNCGLLLKNFNFPVSADSHFFETEMIEEVFKILLVLMKESKSALQWYTLKTLSAVCWQDSSYFFKDELKSVYENIIFSRGIEVNLKCQVLNNFHEFFSFENETLCCCRGEFISSTSESINNSGKLANQEDKILERRIAILQTYLNLILFCCVTQEEKLRLFSITILQIVIQDGLIPPQKVIPHLIALTTDNCHAVSISALQMLNDVNLSHPGILHSCIRTGVNLSFDLQVRLQTNICVRGVEEASPNAFLRHVYSIVQHNKRGRRSFIRTLLRDLEETVGDMNKLLYLSDTLAYLPYEFQDELLYIIHVIGILAATTGFSFVEEFRQLLQPNSIVHMPSEENKSQDDECNDSVDRDNCEEDHEDNFLERIPDDTSKLEECVISFQNCIFLLRVKKFLQEAYRINNRKMIMYSPEQEEGEENIQTHISSFNKYISPDNLDIIAALNKKNHLKREHIIGQYMELKNLVLLDNSELDKHLLKTKLIDSKPATRKRNPDEVREHLQPRGRRGNNKVKRNKKHSKSRFSSDSDYEP